MVEEEVVVVEQAAGGLEEEAQVVEGEQVRAQALQRSQGLCLVRLTRSQREARKPEAAGEA